MTAETKLEGRRILAVDDENDVLEVILDQLEMCAVETETTYEGARSRLETETYDLVILDIMGVRGFELLDACRRKRIPAVMLTAHALTPESLQRSIDLGAVSFLPKEELSQLSELVREILEQVDKGQTHWTKLGKRLGPRFRELWGQMWDEIRFPRTPFISW